MHSNNTKKNQFEPVWIGPNQPRTDRFEAVWASSDRLLIFFYFPTPKPFFWHRTIPVCHWSGLLHAEPADMAQFSNPCLQQPQPTSGGSLSLSLSFPSPLSLFLSFLSPSISVPYFTPESYWWAVGIIWHALNYLIRDGCKCWVPNNSFFKISIPKARCLFFANIDVGSYSTNTRIQAPYLLQT